MEDSSNPKGYNRLKIEYDNIGFFNGYYLRKGYTTICKIPNWLGKLLVH